jgi:hypothetical protein
MKLQDLFSRPIINLTNFASVDVSRFLHAPEAQRPHRWTFQGPNGSEWSTIQVGAFNEASRKAVKAYSSAYGTKYAHLTLTNMSHDL